MVNLKELIRYRLQKVISDLDTIFATSKFYKEKLREGEPQECDRYRENDFREALRRLAVIRKELNGYMENGIRVNQYRHFMELVKDILYCKWKMEWSMDHFEEVKLKNKSIEDSVCVAWYRINSLLSRHLYDLPIEKVEERRRKGRTTSPPLIPPGGEELEAKTKTKTAPTARHFETSQKVGEEQDEDNEDFDDDYYTGTPSWV